ncbi:carboxylate-amine ligase [Pseudomonas sp. S31]|uniref:carboxylate-amine ligase n=1 Tax=Pseudomonas sp. S31 TaxID=1564473 RepID=UPI00191322BF|nr:carboxylate-amine ligase [Pseudomonas sp. S31]MBK5001873.1 carboxylate-amine ligase [Pseudomonas sp. S31]
MTEACTFGIEEEYLLVCLDNGRVLAAPGKAVARCCEAAVGPYLANEMFRSQIEIASPVFHNLQQARGFFVDHRQRLVEALAEHGLGLYGGASHPCAQWQRQHPRPEPHYRQVFADYQHVARQSLLCGLHVHVGVPAECDRMQLINRVLRWLPLFLALSTSSPLWAGQVTGYSSYRRVICAQWPHMNLPEPLADWGAYQRYRALLQRTGALADDGDFWWAIRPSRRYPTVELRICDACPRLEDALCIAGLFRHLVAHCLAPGHDPAPLTEETRWITQENYWRAMRHGLHGLFIGVQAQLPTTALGWLAQLQAMYPVDTGDAEHAFSHARRIIAEGTSADRQLQCLAHARAAGLNEAQAMQQVVMQVLQEGGSGCTTSTAPAFAADPVAL